MTDQSPSPTAETADNDWYRSPVVLVAGLLLFLGALALVVLAVTGGDDTAAPPSTEASGAPAASAEPPAPAATVGPISFGGNAIPEVDTVIFEGEPLPQAGGGDDPAVGTLAPVVTATNLTTGEPVTLGPGQARVIGFFAHWCPHCQDELPQVTEWLAANELPPNTEFVAVSTVVDEGRGNYPPSEWFADVGFRSSVIVDDADNSLLSGFGFSGFPAFIAIDSSGAVVARAGGNIGTEGLAELFNNFAS